MGQVFQGEYYRFEGGRYDGQTLRVTVDGDYVQMDDTQPEPLVQCYADAPWIDNYTFKVLTYRKTRRFSAGGLDWWWVFVLV